MAKHNKKPLKVDGPLHGRLLAEALDLGFMFAAYTDADRPEDSPPFDVLQMQAIRVRKLQAQLRELA